MLDGAQLDGGDGRLDLFFPSDVDRTANIIWIVDSGRVLRCNTQLAPPVVEGIYLPGAGFFSSAESVAAITDTTAYVGVSRPNGASTIELITYSAGTLTQAAMPVAGTGAGNWNGDYLNATAMNFGSTIDALHLDGQLLFVADTGNSRVVVLQSLA